MPAGTEGAIVVTAFAGQLDLLAGTTADVDVRGRRGQLRIQTGFDPPIPTEPKIDPEQEPPAPESLSPPLEAWRTGQRHA